MKFFTYLFFIVSVLCAGKLHAAEERFSGRIDNTSTPAIAVGGMVEVYDDKYFDMLSDPWWSNRYTNVSIRNKVTVGLNKEVAQLNTFANGIVQLRITKAFWNGTGFTTSPPTTVNLTVRNNLVGTQEITDLASYLFTDGQYVKVEILGVSGGVAIGDIFIESEILVERNYAFDGTVVTGLQATALSGPDAGYLEFSWNTKDGAESYELEWVHVHDYTFDANTPMQLSAIRFNFYLNSTRIVLKGNNYKVPLIFDRGYVVFRVRAVGLQGAAFNLRNEGAWSSGEAGNVAAHSAGAKYHVTQAYGATLTTTELNWSHQVAYTESGKRGEAVSFVDGLGRARQTVAHNTETKQAVVSNVYYDHLGRPVISDLPTPVDVEALKYTPAFNKADGTNMPYGPDYFDEAPGFDTCLVTSRGFSTASGAGQYYSPQNPDVAAENANIPDAEKFPFSRVTYLPDYTGRVSEAGAAGQALKIGGGHETRFEYISPNQVELNRLFGAEVGIATHYQKVVTLDPNGQIYVQYTDMAGRVVASYMAGSTPENLDSLPDTPGDTVNVTLISGLAGQDIHGLPELYSEFTYDEYIYADGNYTFNYEFTPIEFNDLCLKDGICLDCVYDLVISVKDDCGHVRWGDTVTVNGGQLDGTCNGEFPGIPPQELYLEQGRYSIYKKLAVNQQAIADYWCTYIDNDTCLTQLDEIFNTLYEAEEFAGCSADEIAEEPLSTCDALRAIMLLDMQPGGQYATYTVSGSTYSSTDPLSIFNLSNGLGTNANWQHPEGGTYKDANGQVIYVHNSANTLVPVHQLSRAEFIQQFDPIWAAGLLIYHPEYCYLEFCEDTLDDVGSEAYDQAMRDVYDFDAAQTAGFFKPLGNQPSCPNCSGTTYPLSLFTDRFQTDHSFPDPYFAVSDHLEGSYYMNNAINTFIWIGTCHFSMWEYALILSQQTTITGALTCEEATALLAASKNLCDLDLVWVNFRNLYLEKKQEIIADALFKYTYVNGCSNSCIGAATPCTGPLGTAWAGKVSRWGNKTQFPNAGVLTESEAEGILAGYVTTACTTTCEAYADEWIERLSGCNFSNVNMAALRDSLINLCMSGCDSDHPVGSSTSESGRSINDVLANFVISNFESNLCSELLISEPLPYETVAQATLRVQTPLDICACDLLYQAELDYNTALANQTLPAGVHSKEQMLALQTGVSLEDIDYLLCSCTAAKGSATWTPEFTWPTGANAALLATGKTVAANLSCGGTCVSCATIDQQLATFHARFSNIPDLEEAENYTVLLTNYLNLELGFSLTYTDYYAFIGRCHATSQAPYCEVNPLAADWSAVMTLLNHRGQLFNEVQNPVNLLTENIVYAHSELQQAFNGDQYWSTHTATDFTAYFGTPAQNPCSISFSLDPDAGFSFEDIICFGDILPAPASCPLGYDFQLSVSYFDCGIVKTALLNGTSGACFPFQTCVCSNPGKLLCNDPFPDAETQCYQPRLDELYQTTLESYQAQLNAVYADYVLNYSVSCAEGFETEHLSYEGAYRSYQYTLFYYDQAGNLVRTVAPEGIEEDFKDSPLFANVDANRLSISNPAIVPAHTFQTTYAFNSYNQLVETTNPDQVGITRFWYDRFGRIAASQNPAQVNVYSYTFYDPQGRPVQVGQVVKSSAPTDAQLLSANPDADFRTWVNAGPRSEVTITQYDEPVSGTNGTAIAARFAAGSQQNLRLRVASVFYYDTYVNTSSAYRSAIHYSYDVHGNVIEQLQESAAMAAVDVAATQRFKSSQYDFELISGNVKQVKYQAGKGDYLAHRYTYDALNRLREVYTTQNDVHLSREAHYRYYDYGPLARVETGEYQVQGSDYAYTINGWLKGMNASTLNIGRDMGKDGTATNYLPGNTAVHSNFARDVLGFTLGYYNDDYKAIGTSTMEAAYIGSDFAAGNNLYNGNIRHTVTAIRDYDALGAAYRYDQLNRLKSMQAYSLTGTGNSWTGMPAITDYQNSYTYDKNGNLKTLVRNGKSTLGLAMDNLSYHYTAGTNRLSTVTDLVPDDPDYDDVKQLQETTPYQYSAIGQLTRDFKEGISFIEWYRGNKKIKRIVRNDLNSDEVAFEYNPFGQRILKIEKPRSNGVLSAATSWNYTYYAYDANGHLMATYTSMLGSTAKDVSLKEQYIYGAGRLGIINSSKLIASNTSTIPAVTEISNKVGNKQYELSNHLGNVNVVINDRKMISLSGSNYEAVVIMKADYYPFGMEMPGRTSNTPAYRFGYNGMEKDDKVNGSGNAYTTEFRQYDPRLGRWMSLDPLMQQFPWMSPYVAFNNNPVYFTDPYGLSAGGPGEPPIGEVCEDEAGEYRVYKGDGEWASPKEFESWLNVLMQSNNNKISNLENSSNETQQHLENELSGELNDMARMLEGNAETKNQLNEITTALDGISYYADPSCRDEWQQSNTQFEVYDKIIMVEHSGTPGGTAAVLSTMVLAGEVAGGDGPSPAGKVIGGVIVLYAVGCAVYQESQSHLEPLVIPAIQKIDAVDVNKNKGIIIDEAQRGRNNGKLQDDERDAIQGRIAAGTASSADLQKWKRDQKNRGDRPSRQSKDKK